MWKDWKLIKLVDSRNLQKLKMYQVPKDMDCALWTHIECIRRWSTSDKILNFNQNNMVHR